MCANGSMGSGTCRLLLAVPAVEAVARYDGACECFEFE